MPVSTFIRRTSNAASSSSSAPPNTATNTLPAMIPLMGTTSNTSGNAGGMAAGSPAYAAAAASGGSYVSEFGSGGGYTAGSMGRAPEGSSRATSPSLSPPIGGAQATFPSTSMAGNQSISQSFQASNIDAQSLHSTTNSAYTASNTSTFTPSSLGAGQHSDMYLREVFTRRIRCLSYLKRCLSIVSYPSASQGSTLATTPAWLDAIKVTKRDLEAVYETEKMKRRSSRYHMLGFSIAPTLEHNSSAEFARALLTIFNEVETMGDGGEKDKAKVRNFFKSSVRGTRRGLGGIDWEMGVGSGGSGASMGSLDLLGSQTPFPLDFFQTTITLCDILVEMYHKLTFFLTSAREAGTVSMTKEDVSTEAQHASVTASTLDTMNKIDGKVKRLVSQTCKELDSLARHVIREELASIDPMMARELGLLDGNGSHFGMEGSAQHSLLEA